MLKLLRKHGKWIMAILGVFLMVIFLLPQRGGGPRRDISKVVYAYAYDNEPVSLLEKQNAEAEVQELTQLTVKYNGKDYPLLNELGFARADIVQHPDEFLLLLVAARHMGLQPSADMVQQFTANVTNMPMEDEDPQQAQLAHYAIQDLALVRSLLDSVGDVVKVSEPDLEHQAASTLQMVSLNIVDYAAANYMEATTQPSQKQIETQYNKFKDTLAKNASASDPLGFGYKYPNRVKLQYIGVLDADLLDPVVAGEPGYQWQVDARQYYLAHPDEFTEAATEPSTLPSAATSRPVSFDDLSPDTQQKIVKAVQENAVAALDAKITSRLTQQLTADWGEYQTAMSNNQPPPMTQFNCPFNSSAYLPALADSIQNDFHVRPRVGLLASSWLSADTLELQEDIGPSILTSGPQAGTSFPDYATQAGFSQN
ncbi:MAG TPA: hypothetical protein VL992_04720, partial [Tepidisphaeraceae bacterium]|nr:hypothetical protein [Tepidisphaeraceae bacterium]